MKLHLHFQSLPSTNNYLKDLVGKYPAEDLQNLFPLYFAVTADEQNSGRGQQGRKWESEFGKNLLASFLLYPNIPPNKQFAVCQYVSVAIAEFIKETFTIPNVYIKWSNDIYIGHKKVVGILIEHSIRCENINYTVAGIGMNINQKFFPYLPNATSIRLETGREHDVIACMNGLIKKIKQTEKLSPTELKTKYLSYLYKKDIFSDFIVHKISNTPISLKIKGVSDTGLLELLDENNNLHQYAFNEIGYMVDTK
jgi:BirA family biotin operon repressor/biotin-[acetyl-CoA-carboxylase] ligase